MDEMAPLPTMLGSRSDQKVMPFDQCLKCRHWYPEPVHRPGETNKPFYYHAECFSCRMRPAGIPSRWVGSPELLEKTVQMNKVGWGVVLPRRPRMVHPAAYPLLVLGALAFALAVVATIILWSLLRAGAST